MYNSHAIENARWILELRAGSALEGLRRSLERQDETPSRLRELVRDTTPRVRKLAVSVHDLRNRFKERWLPDTGHLAWPDCRHGSGSVEALALGD